MTEPKAMVLTPPTADQMKRILTEINLTEVQHKKDMKVLKEWLQSQPHLPHDLDDTLLASFLVGSKNSLECGKHHLDTYLTNRTSCPDFYSNRDPCDPNYRRLTKIFQYFVLPDMTPEGYRVSVFRLQCAEPPPEDVDLRMNAIKVLCSYDVRFLQDCYWAGDITIVNCRHFSFKHLQCVTIPLVKKYIHCVNESLPVRQKKIIFINMSSVLEPVILMVKKLMKKKLAQRIVVSSEDYPFLYNYVPRDMLPDEYGGKAGKLEDLNDSWQLNVERHREWFLEDMKRQVDETKRPGKSTHKPKQQFGVQGSFRTLAID